MFKNKTKRSKRNHVSTDDIDVGSHDIRLVNLRTLTTMVPHSYDPRNGIRLADGITELQAAVAVTNRRGGDIAEIGTPSAVLAVAVAAQLTGDHRLADDITPDGDVWANIAQRTGLSRQDAKMGMFGLTIGPFGPTQRYFDNREEWDRVNKRLADCYLQLARLADHGEDGYTAVRTTERLVHHRLYDAISDYQQRHYGTVDGLPMAYVNHASFGVFIDRGATTDCRTATVVQDIYRDVLNDRNLQVPIFAGVMLGSTP